MSFSDSGSSIENTILTNSASPKMDLSPGLNGAVADGKFEILSLFPVDPADSSDLNRPTGPGAPCWCGCPGLIPRGKKKTARYVNDDHKHRADTARCIRRLREARLSYIKKTKAEAEKFITDYPVVIYTIVAWIRDDIAWEQRRRENDKTYIFKCRMKINFRFYWEKYRREARCSGDPIEMNDHWEKYVKINICARHKDIAPFIQFRKKTFHEAA